MKVKVRKIREVWDSLKRCGQIAPIYDKEGKLVREVKLKFSYAISKNINLLKSETESLEPIDKRLAEYNNEIVALPKEHPERFFDIQAKYAPLIAEREQIDNEEREIEIYKIKADTIPEGILGIDLANLDFLIEGEI